MTEDQDAKDSQSDSGSKTFVNKNKDKKTKTQRPLTKVTICFYWKLLSVNKLSFATTEIKRDNNCSR